MEQENNVRNNYDKDEDFNNKDNNTLDTLVSVKEVEIRVIKPIKGFHIYVICFYRVLYVILNKLFVVVYTKLNRPYVYQHTLLQQKLSFSSLIKL